MVKSISHKACCTGYNKIVIIHIPLLWLKFTNNRITFMVITSLEAIFLYKQNPLV